jgi:tetratricopeptide (TPR) repeat protein
VQSSLDKLKRLFKDLEESLLKELESVPEPTSPQEVYWYVKTQCILSELLLRLNPDKYRERVREVGIKCLDIFSKWINEIRSEHVPEFKGLITDYEARAHIMWYIINLLSNVMSGQELENVVNGYGDYIKSIYLYHKASEYHVYRGMYVYEYSKAIELLGEALKYSPDNETLKFFRALWKYQLAQILSANTCTLLKEAIKEFEEVVALAPTWREPSERLKDAEDMYNKLCSPAK